MKHNPMATANAAAATTAIVYILCRILVGISPNFMLEIARSWFHTAQLQARVLGGVDVFIIGLVTSTVFAWLVGYLFAYFYNMFAKK
jgi:uncharacterized membrane protein